MIGYNTKLTIRNFYKHRLFFIISILGLAIGIAASTLLYIYIQYEKSYDKFYPQTDNLYRINYHLTKDGKQMINSCRTQTALSRMLQDEPEVIAASTRILYEECYMYTENVKLFGQQVLWADSSFLNVFQPEMISGDASSALANKYSVVISDEVAHTYFGDADPVNKVIRLNEGMPFTVTGVFKAIPANTHLHYDFVVSFITLEDYGVNREGNWNGNYVSTYFRKVPSASETTINQLLKNLSDKYLAGRNRNGEEARFSIMPVKNIYLKSKLEGEYQRQGNESKIELLAIIAFFILVIAWVNNINIATALSFERARESGILKLHGAGNMSLIRYYLSEAFMVNLLSVVLSIVLFIPAFPVFKSLINERITLNVFTQPWLWKMYGLIFLGGVFFTGIITALIQSSVKPLHVLSNMMSGNLKFSSIRRVLAVSQFSIAIVLIISTIVIYKQINYLETRDLGMKADQVLVMRAPATNNTSGGRRYTEFLAFRKELLQSPYIKTVTATMNIPGQPNRYKDVIVSKNGQEVKASFDISYADESYFETYQVPIIAGRNFYGNINNERYSVIVNEKALDALGFESAPKAIGERIQIGQSSMEIVGVAKNFHHESLQKEIEPYIYQFRHPHEFGYYPALVSTSNMPELMKYVERVWTKHYPDAQADFFFLNTFFNKQYQTYMQLGKLVGISSLLAILIACLGLFAFVSYTVHKKVKEIGIRKVNGAGTGEILTLLNHDFIKWIVIAFVIATPLAYYAMHKWLENFACKTSLSWWIFALAGLLALGIALLTVSWQSWRAATRNPVESLRYE